MLTYPQQIELLNLKESIVNNPALRQRLTQMLGQRKGWREFSEELGSEYSVVRHLKDMALSELYYSTRDFTALRAEVFNEEKEDMLRHPKRKAVIILNSPNAVVELTTVSRKPLTITTARKASPVTLIANKKKTKETIQISHDTDLPIYIFGNVEELICTGQRLTECYLVNCPNLSRLDVSNNQLAKMRLCQSMPKLRVIDLHTNCLPIDAVGKMLQSLCNLSLENLFDTEPQILTDASITGDLRWQAKQIGWIIKNV
jgi:hypothetical protein